jgi:hypothetical protein
VTELELNRGLLARQLLLERVRLPIPRVLERIGGIQNQYAPNAYIRLASCLEGFRRDDLTRALERRTVVQGTLMRSTIHLVSSREYWLFAEGIRRARQAWWLRVQKRNERDIEARASRLREALADGPLTRRSSTRASGSASVGAAAPRSGWTSSACRRRGRGSSAERTATRSRSSGWGRRPRPSRKGSSTSSGATSAASARRR